MKQYNPKKPHKWGYKVISRAGSSGYIYDFKVYTGKTGAETDNFGLGVSSGFVMRLPEDIPIFRNYKLFYDNWFSSIGLAKKLKDEKIHSLSTVRSNRLKICKLKENQLKNEGKGSYDYRAETKENIMVLKWFDNKSDHILLTYIGLFPLEEAKRWDRKKKDYIKVQMPHAIAEYNKFIRDVDLCDMFFELYRIDFKSKKWYMKIFSYVLL